LLTDFVNMKYKLCPYNYYCKGKLNSLVLSSCGSFSDSATWHQDT
jgi:hypothetical protein